MSYGVERHFTMITCIHGFLGRPADWDFLRHEGFEVEAISLDEAAALPGGPKRAGEVLLGYSMGGRLALEALLRGASFERAVIISAGLNLEDGREERRTRDDIWALRFEEETWKEVVESWNAQPLFGGRVLDRSEELVDRATIAASLRRYSPGVMEPLRPRLRAIEIPVLWIAGERDDQYASVAREAVAILPHGQLWICPDAHHRVPWEKPGPFAERLRQFVSP